MNTPPKLVCSCGEMLREWWSSDGKEKRWECQVCRPDFFLATCGKCGVVLPGRRDTRRRCNDCLGPTSSRKRSEPEGAGPLADPTWRRLALAAIEAWETWGAETFTRDEWFARFYPHDSGDSSAHDAALRQWERLKQGWRAVLGIELELVGRGSETVAQSFPPDSLDRLTLIRDLLDRYLVWKDSSRAPT